LQAKIEQKRNENKTHKRKLTGCAEEWPIPVKTRTWKKIKNRTWKVNIPTSKKKWK
jgi:hypothetical protein